MSSRLKATDEEFRLVFARGGAVACQEKFGMTVRNAYKRRKEMEERGAPILSSPNAPLVREYPHRATLTVKNGCVIVGSDFHIWPGAESTALRAFKKFCKDLKPAAVILNGDVLDFPKISRHPPIGWESTPSPIEEIEAAQDHLDDIVKACGRAHKIWTLGNHDARFETRLATVAPEYRGVKGIHLSDNFPLWKPAWSCWINNDVVVKHRGPKGGKTHNNTLYAGKTIVQGHRHCARVTPFSDYNGTRYEFDTGCVAETDHRAFTDYTEDGPLDWRSSFGILTFINGQLLMPELVMKWDDKHVQFRGELIRV